MLNEYRRRYGDYHTELNREEYLFRSGDKDKRDSGHVLSEFSDLFTPEVVKELRESFEKTSPYLDNERTSIERLIDFAIEGSLAAKVRQIYNEIEGYESSARIDWPAAEVGFNQAAELIREEPDSVRRHDLYKRRADVIDEARDLWSELFEVLHQGARDLGYRNYLKLCGELRGIDYNKIASQAIQVLSKTEHRYVSALASRCKTSIDEARMPDLERLLHFTDFDPYFSPERLLDVYSELVAGLGFKAAGQTNLKIYTEPGASKESSAFCFPIYIPDEIKLVVSLNGGQRNYRELLRESGRAQSYAWTSRNLYPEFRIGADLALLNAWGLLFENLMTDRQWLMGTFGLVESGEFQNSLGFFRMLAIRRQAGLVNYEVEFHAGKLSGAAGSSYAQRMSDALRVQCDEAEHLRDLNPPFYSAGFLRACAFESQLRDYFKTKFGLRWWTSRKAGEMLVDLWNTGQRHTVEEMAMMIGLGELNFDWLVEDLLGQK